MIFENLWNNLSISFYNALTLKDTKSVLPKLKQVNQIIPSCSTKRKQAPLEIIGFSYFQKQPPNKMYLQKKSLLELPMINKGHAAYIASSHTRKSQRRTTPNPNTLSSNKANSFLEILKLKSLSINKNNLVPSSYVQKLS